MDRIRVIASSLAAAIDSMAQSGDGGTAAVAERLDRFARAILDERHEATAGLPQAADEAADWYHAKPQAPADGGEVMSTNDLRVFHLTGELRAVSKEATEHAEARAALIEQVAALTAEKQAKFIEHEAALCSALAREAEMMAERDKYKSELIAAQRNNHQRNVELDAVGYVWCSGTCKGTKRFTEGDITAEHVAAAMRNTDRMYQSYVNRAGTVGADRSLEAHGERWRVARAKVATAEVEHLRTELGTEQLKLGYVEAQLATALDAFAKADAEVQRRDVTITSLAVAASMVLDELHAPDSPSVDTLRKLVSQHIPDDALTRPAAGDVLLVPAKDPMRNPALIDSFWRDPGSIED